MIITKTQLSRELGLSKGRVSQLLRRGLPVRQDGSIDRDLAMTWYRSNIVRPDREGSRVAGEPGHVAAKCAAVPAVPALAVQYGAMGAHAAVVDALRRVASPLEILAFAKVALAAGASPTIAFVVGLWYATSPSMALPELDDNDVSDFGEPTEDQWRELLGGDFDFDSAGTLYDQATALEI